MAKVFDETSWLTKLQTEFEDWRIKQFAFFQFPLTREQSRLLATSCYIRGLRKGREMIEPEKDTDGEAV